MADPTLTPENPQSDWRKLVKGVPVEDYSPELHRLPIALEAMEADAEVYLQPHTRGDVGASLARPHILPGFSVAGRMLHDVQRGEPCKIAAFGLAFDSEHLWVVKEAGA